MKKSSGMSTRRKIRHALIVLILALMSAILLSKVVLAQDQIVRPFQNVRASAMGGVKITTGLYEENFFGNPARVTQNPKSMTALFDLSVETSGAALGNVSALLSSGSDALKVMGNSAGSNNHLRLQTTFPGFYVKDESKTAYAFAIITSTQADLALRRSYRVNPLTIFEIGPVFTLGRTFLQDDRLSLGATAHATYRLSSQTGYTLIDFIKGKSLSPSESGGSGAQADFDVGGFYKLPVAIDGWNLSVGGSVTNILGGTYGFFSTGLGNGSPPIPQPRSYHVGVSGRRETIWRLTDNTVALEITDFGNNPGGSIFRTIHLGYEARYNVVWIRTGLNQGYWTAGVGMRFNLMTIDFTTYGEELSLNIGGLEDRRYALKLAIQI